MKVDKTAKKIALARVRAGSDKMRILIAGKGIMGKKEMLDNIKNDTQIGRKLVDIQMEFLKDMASGKFYSNE